MEILEDSDVDHIVLIVVQNVIRIKIAKVTLAVFIEINHCHGIRNNQQVLVPV